MIHTVPEQLSITGADVGESFQDKIAVGTQVVLRADVDLLDRTGRKKSGSVGIVDRVPQTPGGAYVVRFADGGLVGVERKGLAIRKTLAPEASLPERQASEFEPYLIYRVIAGSRAYGLADEDSDADDRGVFAVRIFSRCSAHASPSNFIAWK